MALPTRTTNDANSAADINSLQTQITSLTATVASATAAIYATLANFGQNVDVDGVSKTLYFKTFTGTLDGSGYATGILHGLDIAKIIPPIGIFVKYNAADDYYAMNYTACRVILHATTYDVDYTVDANFQNQPYKVTIPYHS